MATELLSRLDEHDLAEQAVQEVARLAERLSPVLGEMGVHAVLARSAAIASTSHPWLAQTVINEPTEPPWAPLRAAMEQQEPSAIREGFVALLETFSGLLERLIGEALVCRLLREVWPEVFEQAVEETT